MTESQIFRRCGFPLTALVLILCACGCPVDKSARPDPVPEDVEDEKHHPDMPWEAPGITRLDVKTAGAAEIDNEAEVLGLSVGGRHRAYLLASFMGIETHIVNDYLEGTPVTVTYCDRNDCARVFTVEQNRSISISLAGWYRNQLTFFDEDRKVHFHQMEGPNPYSDHPFERMTWKEWKTAHPDTDVYVGRLPRKDDSEDSGDRDAGAVPVDSRAHTDGDAGPD